jgi:alkaline phosphatase D
VEKAMSGLQAGEHDRRRAVDWTIELRQPIPVADLEPADERRLATRVGNDSKARRAFPQSVASGDPSETGVVLWTRIGPDAYEAGTPVLLEIAEDGRFARGRRCYEIDATETGPERDYTVKVDLDGTLEADRRYYYRFGYDDATSRTGRCRTLPAADSSPESVRFGVFTCQNYLNGYFGAHHHLAREDVDFLLDLGDSIYEVGDLPGTREKYAGHRVDLESQQKFVDTLEDYRGIYRTYRSNQFLQEALERHTRIHVWDDHEFVNDVYWEEDSEGTIVPRARKHSASHPKRSDTAFMLALIAGAIQAWSEYTPARFERGSETGPLNERVKLYQRFQFGDLLALIRTDERLYKSRTQSHWSEYWIEHAPTEGLEQLLRQWLSRPEEDSRSMLGKTQREWFLEEVTRPGTTWTVWANEVLTLPIPIPVPIPLPVEEYTHDAWDGYRGERRAIMDAVANARRNGDVENFVTLTGDMHSHLAGYQCQRYPVRDLLRRPRSENRVGVELMTPAVTSGNISEEVAEKAVKYEGPVGDAMRSVLADGFGRLLTRVVERFRYIEFFDSHEWGYSVVEFTPDYCTHRTYSVDKRTNARDAKRRLFKEFRVPNGEIEIEEVA